MSFMFKPYPYDDPNAVNVMDASCIDTEMIADGNVAAVNAVIEKILEKKAEAGYAVAGIDGYPTADFDRFMGLFSQKAKEKAIAYRVVNIREYYADSEALYEKLKEECLPEDTVKDPVLLYGKLFDGTYEDLLDGQKLAGLKNAITSVKSNNEIIVIYGQGALCNSLLELVNVSIFMDVTPMKTMLSLNKGQYTNVGAAEPIPFKMMARRCYYVDFELAARERLGLLRSGLIDAYICASDPERLVYIPIKTLKQIFDRSMEYPLRAKPVYLEGVWGGYFIQEYRQLPKEMKNCAWVFDLIPMEVSIVFELNGVKYEFPFYTLVQDQGMKLMGKRSVDRFGYYFPVRFNYDDTFHSNGNMSVQCHPKADMVMSENNELGRQDESYYIVACAQDAKTYLGFNDDANVEEFIEKIKESEKTGKEVDYRKYVNAVESKPGVQVMIPAGTIHASGRNQLILEIGSLTVGSYTYKMYDYCRKDLDGKPRPIHSYYGSQALARERKTTWVNQNIVNGGYRIVREGENWQEYVVGEHELLYFSLRNMKFIDKIEDNTNGSFQVLTLVDGRAAKIVSKKNPERFFIQNYLDVVVVPADFGEYEIVNLTPGTTLVEHKTMLNPDHD